MSIAFPSFVDDEEASISNESLCKSVQGGQALFEAKLNSRCLSKLFYLEGRLTIRVRIQDDGHE